MNKRVAVKIRPWSRPTSFPWVIRDTLALADKVAASLILQTALISYSGLLLSVLSGDSQRELPVSRLN